MNETITRKAIARLGFTPDRWLLVDVVGQRVALMSKDAAAQTWPASTAVAGLDARQDSGGTPPGLHRIHQRIGQGAHPDTIFSSRRPTGEFWNGQPDERDLILARILTLEGCEEGVNRGSGVDSLARYIYLHGTNHEDRLGEPVSHGCIRLGNADVVDVCDRVREGDPVVIV